jgi:hypothetical protein
MGFAYSSTAAALLSHEVISICYGQAPSHWRHRTQSLALPPFATADA